MMPNRNWRGPMDYWPAPFHKAQYFPNTGSQDAPLKGSQVRRASGMVHTRKAICFEVVTMDSAHYSAREAL